MIDAVTVSTFVGKYLDVPHCKDRYEPVTWKYYRGAGILDATVHVPRWVTGTACNFPLVDGLTLERLRCDELTAWLADGTGLVELRDVGRWALRSAEVTLDVQIPSSVSSTILSYAGARRKNSRNTTVMIDQMGSCSVYRERGASGVETILYDKSGQLRARHPSAAMAAMGTLRFEIRLQSAAAIRSIFLDLDSHDAPTIGALFDPAVPLYLFSREARRMYMHRDAEAVSQPEDFRARTLRFRDWSRDRV